MHDKNIMLSFYQMEYKLPIDLKLIRSLDLVIVAYSHIQREWFSTEDAYIAEAEVEERAEEVIEAMKKLGVNVKGYAGDEYFFGHVLVDKPDLVFNLVDTVWGRDRLQPAIPGALELSKIPYTGAGLEGLVIGNNRHLFKQVLIAHEIPTPRYKFMKDMRNKIPEDLGTPLIVKLTESGGSVGIDNKAVKETLQDATAKVESMLSAYGIPVIVEQFVGGPEITGCVYDDGSTKHIFLGQKVFGVKPDGKYEFTSIESYEDIKSYKYKVPDETILKRITPLVSKAFDVLKYKDYAKFDIRLDEIDGTPYFVDCNPNTAFGPDKGLPFTEVLKLHKVPFEDVLASLLTKYARQVRGLGRVSSIA